MLRKRTVKIVLCGSTTHVPEDVEEDNIRYLNAGSWFASPRYFAGLRSDTFGLIKFAS